MKTLGKRILFATKNLLFVCSLMPFFTGCDDASSSIESDGVTIEDNIFVDKRDGSKYRVFSVGSDVWMAENLRYADSAKSKNLKGNMWCPDGKAEKCKEFGPLYSWTAARDLSSDFLQETYGKGLYQLQGICPEGWRLPTNNDWVYLSKVAEKYSGEESVAEVLRSPEGWVSWGSDIHIYDPDWFGFDAQPAGRRNFEGGYLESGLFAFFWTADEIDDATASGWTLRDDNDVLDSGKYYKEHGMSVRCVVDEPEKIQWLGDKERARFSFNYGHLQIGTQVYKTLQIGSYIWMAENMNEPTENSRCYDDDENNCKKYGRLYSFEEASTICPSGWKLPALYQWDDLLYEARNDANLLMAVDSWYHDAGYDALGFAMLPAGVYDNGSYSDLTVSAYFWADEEEDFSKNLGITFHYYSSIAQSGFVSPSSYASVRCIWGGNY